VNSKLLEGKTGLIMGVANKWSIAWGIAQSVQRAGARIVLTYQNERLGQNAEKLARELDNPLLIQCDVANDDEIDRLMDSIQTEVGGLDFVVHALAYAPREALSGAYADTSREAFRIALDVSAYSLVAVARRAAPLMKDRNGSIVTLTYLGSERVVKNYNVMGVAKAALEASVRYTLSSSAVSGISSMVKMHAERAPLRSPTDIGEVGDTALFLVSPLSRGITGEIIYVDGGYHVLGA